MTDNEIIKAMEWLERLKRDTDVSEWAESLKIILNEYNRQKAEIERLQTNEQIATAVISESSAEIEELQRTITELQHKNKELKTAKSEAIKEFAERLTDKADLIKVNPFDSKWAISQDNIDNLVKEMTE